MVVTPGEPGSESLTYERVQSLRNVQDKVISTKASCNGDLQVLNGLAQLKGAGMEALYGLPFQIKQLEGFIDSADVLCSQIRNTIELVRWGDEMIERRDGNVANARRSITRSIARSKWRRCASTAN